ncbi:MAG: PAS domain S-box protein [Nitrospirota bacterium]|nr:PAS domain S-box protein [Nitrospirota bacterium]
MNLSVYCPPCEEGNLESQNDKSSNVSCIDEKWFHAVCKSIGDAVMATDKAGIVQYLNPVSERLTGWLEKDAVGRPLESVFRIINEETRKEVEDPVKKVLREGRAVGLANPTLLISKDGTEIPIADSGSPIRDCKDEIVGVVLVFSDQTEERKAQYALQEAKEFAESIVATIREPLIVLDAQLKVISANHRFCQSFQVEEKETAGRHIYDLGNRQWDIPGLRELLEDILPQNTSFSDFKVEHEFEHIGKRIMLLNARRIYHEANKTRLILLSIEDVTEHLRLEDQYRQAQKLEAIGLLSGGVAHDFNNLLTVILGYGEVILRRLHRDDPLRQDINKILNACHQGASLTHQLLAFSRRQTLQPEVIELNRLLDDQQKLLRRLIGENIEFITTFADNLGRVKADPGQIEQVIMNLAVNARDAMPRGGKLIIETSNVELDKEYSKGHISVVPGKYVMLAITDTGVGMDKETRGKIFEPFFTTKELGRGTGLGLSTVYGIVKQSGGHIWVYSEPDKGTTFKIYLPCTEDAPTAKVEHEEVEVQSGCGHILVVEDESAIRELIEIQLENLGYQVTLAANGGEALLAIEEKGIRPDLLITDVVMPGMSGVVLLKRLRKTLPELRVLFMSGYTDNVIVHQGILDPGIPFIQKPFSIKGLSAIVCKELQSSK